MNARTLTIHADDFGGAELATCDTAVICEVSGPVDAEAFAIEVRNDDPFADEVRGTVVLKLSQMDAE